MNNFTSLLKISSFALLLSGTISVNAQNQNALSLDGVDDYMVAPGASSLVQGSTQLSMTCWVYPTNTAPAYPDFDGFAGMRNETDGDFYLLQISPSSTLEARFRNSSNQAFSIAKNCLVLNVWQHLGLTYDGAKMRLYYNGNKIDSIAATGVIGPTGSDFYAGNVLYQFTNFYLHGKVDEVSLWNKTLSASEVRCIYKGEIDSTSANLQLYYQFNQGVANGVNTSVTTATDKAGNINGTLSGFALTGTSSNWVAGVNTFTQLNVSMCPGSAYTFGTQTLFTTGNYTEAFAGSSGCDSIVKLNLFVGNIDTTVTVLNNVLTAAQTNATYQWINCATGLPVAGAINRTYSSTVGGTFAVVVTFSNCSDTSGCHTILPVGISETLQSNEVALYPNPSANSFTVELAKAQHNLSVSVKNIEGKEMMTSVFDEVKQFSVDAATWAHGVYVMELSTPEGKAYKRLMKK